MSKNVDKIGSLENFKAPWETDAGETEIDKDRLKRFLYNLTVDKAKAQDSRDEVLDKVTALETDLKAAKAEAEKGGDPDLAKTLEDERKKTAEQTERADKAEKALLVNEVAQEKGLTPKQAKRLTGDTKEELEKDAEDLLETFGGGKSSEEGEEEHDEEGNPLVTTPRSLTNPGDPQAGRKVSREPDYEAVAAELQHRRL